MYESTTSADKNSLRAGDIIKLKIEDFKKIIRHEPLIELFKDFENNPDYNSNFWAILNKNCDMVHDTQKKRYFKNNLFIAPLQGLRSALKKGTLGKLLKENNEIQRVDAVFINAYKEYFEHKARSENPKKTEESTDIYHKKISTEIVSPTIDSIKYLIPNNASEYDNLNGLLDTIKSCVTSKILSGLDSFGQSTQWKTALNKLQRQHKTSSEEKSNITLKSNASRKIAVLALNQLDSQGLFYYEPHENISSKRHDLSYLIQLEDIITLKVKKNVQISGELFELLIKNRKVMLKRNFSDRLLNIMGNYFSKIGTPDLMSDKILILYKNIYPNTFLYDDS